MRGAIIVNAYMTGENIMYQPLRLSEELAKLSVDTDIISNNKFFCHVEGDSMTSTLSEYDFVVYLDKDKYVLNMLDNMGIKVFNNYQAIVTCDDKMSTYIKLANSGVPMPNTIAGLLCYDNSCVVSADSVQHIENSLNYPLVAKKSYGSFGTGVYLVENRQQLTDTLNSLKLQPHLLQQFVGGSRGRDVRVIVIGGKVVGAMLRENNSDFRSNVAQGGKTSIYVLESEDILLAEKVASVLDLDYCGIDLLFGENGMQVCEVNSNALFSAFENTTGINVAEIYAKHIVDSCNK